MVQMTLFDPPSEVTHWAALEMNKASGISISLEQRVWCSHGLQPQLMRQFTLASDRRFADKIRDIVGLQVDSLARAVVLQMQIPSLDTWG